MRRANSTLHREMSDQVDGVPLARMLVGWAELARSVLQDRGDEHTPALRSALGKLGDYQKHKELLEHKERLVHKVLKDQLDQQVHKEQPVQQVHKEQ